MEGSPSLARQAVRDQMSDLDLGQADLLEHLPRVLAELGAEIGEQPGTKRPREPVLTSEDAVARGRLHASTLLSPMRAQISDEYPFRKPGEQRGILRIEPTHLIVPKD